MHNECWNDYSSDKLFCKTVHRIKQKEGNKQIRDRMNQGSNTYYCIIHLLKYIHRKIYITHFYSIQSLIFAVGKYHKAFLMKTINTFSKSNRN